MDAATQTDMEARFSSNHLLEIADKNGDGTVDASFLAAHLSQANSLAVGIAGSLATTPSYVIGWQCDLAAYTMAKESRASLADEHRTAMEAALQGFQSLRAPAITGSTRNYTLAKTDGL